MKFFPPSCVPLKLVHYLIPSLYNELLDRTQLLLVLSQLHGQTTPCDPDSDQSLTSLTMLMSGSTEACRLAWPKPCLLPWPWWSSWPCWLPSPLVFPSPGLAPVMGGIVSLQICLDVIELRWGHSGVIHCDWWPYKKRRHRQHTEEEAMWPWMQNFQGHCPDPGNARSHQKLEDVRRIFPLRLQKGHGPTSTLILDSCLQTARKWIWIVVSHPVHGTWLWESQEMNRAPKAQGPEV